MEDQNKTISTATTMYANLLPKTAWERSGDKQDNSIKTDSPSDQLSSAAL